MKCEICPRRCGVERNGHNGICGVPDTFLLARAALHHWEEPCISGERGSGTVFFTGCNLGCIFCQNHEISQRGRGMAVTAERLNGIFRELAAQGAHNINLVTPTHYTESLLPLLDGIELPVVWNSSAYERTQTLSRLSGKVDIYLPDFKFADPHLAAVAANAPDYPDVARAAITEMYRQVGPYRMKDGLLLSGLLIRHLVLPGQLNNTYAVIDWVAETFEPGQVLFSLMSQYTPYRPTGGDWDRRLDKREWIKARNYMKRKGLFEGYVQDLSSAKAEYTPPFDLTGL